MQNLNKTFVFILLMLFSICSVAFAQEGEIVKEWREVSGFTEIVINGPFEVYIIQNSGFDFSLEGDKESMRDILTSVQGSILNISLISNKNASARKVKLYIKMPDLRKLKLFGEGFVKSIGLKSGKLEVELFGTGTIDLDEFAGSFFELQNTGTGKIDLNVNAESIRAVVRGSGEIILSGNTTATEFTVSGSGKITALELFQIECLTKIYGNGSVSVLADQLIDAEIIGVGNLTYKGDPEIHMKSVGSGKIIRIKQENL